MKKKYICTRRLRKWGDSLVVALNRKQLEKKGMVEGDIVHVDVELLENVKDKELVRLIGEKMKKENVKELKIKLVDNKEVENKGEQNERESIIER